MLDGACEDGGAVLSPIVGNIEYGADPQEMRHFISVESDFYPDLERYYQARVARWFAENIGDAEEGDDD